MINTKEKPTSSFIQKQLDEACKTSNPSLLQKELAIQTKRDTLVMGTEIRAVLAHMGKRPFAWWFCCHASLVLVPLNIAIGVWLWNGPSIVNIIAGVLNAVLFFKATFKYLKEKKDIIELTKELQTVEVMKEQANKILSNCKIAQGN